MTDKEAALRDFAEALNRRMRRFAEAGVPLRDVLAALRAEMDVLQAELARAEAEIAALEAKLSPQH